MREKYIDTIKGVAIVFVVLLHVVSAGWYGNEDASQWLGYIAFLELSSSMCVSLFFVATGMTMLNREKTLSVKRVLCHNLPRLMVPLVVYSFLYEILNFVIEKREESFFPGFLKDFIKVDIEPSLWFMYAIICTYLMLPVIKVFTDFASKKMKQYFLIMWFLSSVFEFLGNTQPFTFVSAYTNNLEFLNVFLHYVGYVILGNYIRCELDEGVKIRWGVIASVLSFVFVVALVYHQYKNGEISYFSYTAMNYCSPFNIIITATGATGMKTLCSRRKMPQWLETPLAKVGEKTLGIYLIHVGILKVAGGYHLLHFGGVYGLKILLYTFVLVSGCYLISAVIGGLKPIGKYLT